MLVYFYVRLIHYLHISSLKRGNFLLIFPYFQEICHKGIPIIWYIQVFLTIYEIILFFYNPLSINLRAASRISSPCIAVTSCNDKKVCSYSFYHRYCIVLLRQIFEAFFFV